MKAILHTTDFSLKIVGSSQPYLVETFEKAGINVKFSDNALEIAELVTDIDQQQYENFFYSRLVTCSKSSSDIIKKNSFIIGATKQKGHITDPNTAKIKDTDFNKLTEAVLA